MDKRRNNLDVSNLESVSGGGDRDQFGKEGRDIDLPANTRVCTKCSSPDVTKTNNSFPYEYVCNACGNVFKLPV